MMSKGDKRQILKVWRELKPQIVARPIHADNKADNVR